MDERLMKAKSETQLAIEIGMEWKKLAQAAEARAEKYREQLLRTHDALYIAEPAAEHCNICRTLFPDPQQERDAGAEG